MNRTFRRILICLPFLTLVSLAPQARAQWTAPTPEELQMTSQPEVPGAPAVYLFREEKTDDAMHNWSKYVRLKVLTERGKEYANVELRQYQDTERGGYSVSDIQGRTIHPDGTIIPFTGKPYEKVVEKGQGFKEVAKVFTLPDVQVGSIIEYRYVLRYDDNYFIAPDWFVQSELYTRKAHYLWKPTGEQLLSKNENGEQLTSSIMWAPVLPVGAEVKQSRIAGGQAILELNIDNVPPMPDEEHMPPIKSFSYRVLFYYTPYRTTEEYWKNEGKGWSKRTDKFIGPGPKVGAAVQQLTAGANTQDEKLRKLYAAVMQLDNTVYSRDRSLKEDKAAGLAPPKNTDDIWERKHGTDDQITQLFVAMARAAGMKAYVMSVTNREHSIFNPHYLSFNQLDDYIAIVNVDGKELVFDPGERDCPYGQLAWGHTDAGGIRQTDGGTELTNSPQADYKSSRTQRVADLTLDEHGVATGTVMMTWTGAPALRWRQMSLRGDETSVRKNLHDTVERLMPTGMDISVTGIQNIDDYEKPLVVNFKVSGVIGSATGKRLILPGDIFEANARPTFPHEKREIAVYFEYPMVMQDAMRIKFPPNMALESQPASLKLPFGQTALYSMDSKVAPNSVTMTRNLVRGEIVYLPKEYPDLRAFYNKFESKDQEPVILKAAAAQAPAGN